MTEQATTETRATHAAKSASNRAMSPSQLLSRAFELDTKSAHNTTTGIQTMAAGIFAYYAEIESSKPKFAAFVEKGQAYLDFKAELVTKFVTPRMTQKDVKAIKKDGDGIAAENNARNSAQMIALNKGIDLANALHYCGISNSSYDVQRGLFVVPATSLAPPDAVIGGRLTKQQAKGGVPLDGATYSIYVDDVKEDFKAYPARIISLAGFKAAKKGKTKVAEVKGASDTTTTGGSDAASVRNDPNTWSFDALLSSAADLLNKAADIAQEGDAVAWSELPVKTRNALEAVALFRDECKLADKVEAATNNVKAA